ncbi:uncharacterized protein G2W53_013730 [Senna tora]|uniref:Uncharacterized protein n=1 Tax=Senna tora TaxID=362788 RepID=A0A834WQZ4_9FABA|nr:uncharacterized protein G2W53_013730 [Senna tora]
MVLSRHQWYYDRTGGGQLADLWYCDGVEAGLASKTQKDSDIAQKLSYFGIEFRSCDSLEFVGSQDHVLMKTSILISIAFGLPSASLLFRVTHLHSSNYDNEEGQQKQLLEYKPLHLFAELRRALYRYNMIQITIMEALRHPEVFL